MGGKTTKQKIGAWGEERACFFLRKHGYTIVDRNFRVRRGELDIIAWAKKPHHGKTLCFVEVKTRSYGNGSAERATGREKMKRLLHAAQAYCLRNYIDISNTPISFEQVSIYIGRGNRVTYRLYTIPIS